MSAGKNLLGDIILDAGILTENQLKQAVDEQKATKKTLFRQICDMKFLPEDELMMQLKNALELQYGVSFLEFSKIKMEETLLGAFPVDVMELYKFFPYKKSGNVFTFAMVEPDNILAEREIKTRLRDVKGLILKKAVILEDDFRQIVSQKFPKQEEKSEIAEHDTDELLSSMGIDVVETSMDDMNLADLADSAQEAPIIQLANSILGVAISRGISDIHIEPREKELLVRFRQDGVLSVYKSMPKKIQNAVVSRYKIMAELDIAERRLPQDGRIRVKMSNKFIDFRVSTLPSKFGEKIVMRILDKSNISLGLDQIITNSDTLKTVREMITRPFGIIFVTGPTGSGKTTTLYSALSERNTQDVNISTVEDPIE
jgi:type IV pilus assembly protein PilB